MNIRSRIEWASLWGILADHFGTVGSISGNTPVAMYTVDCLRQLALKFLDKVWFVGRNGSRLRAALKLCCADLLVVVLVDAAISAGAYSFVNELCT